MKIKGVKGFLADSAAALKQMQAIVSWSLGMIPKSDDPHSLIVNLKLLLPAFRRAE